MSTDDLVIGIDAGTVGVRAGLFTLQGQPLGFSDQPYATLYPRASWAEQEPAAWWDALVAAVRGCLATTQVQRSRIIGLAIDAPCNLLLVDQDGRPLMNSLIWMDLRGTEQAAQLSATSDAVLDYCGGTVPAEWPLPKALWLKQHEPALWMQATYLTEQMSWLTWRLTDVWAFPQNSAVAKWHYRVTSTPQTPAGWPVGLLQAVGLDDLLSKIRGTVIPLGGQAGTLSAQAAKALGLASSIPVSLSGIDAYAGMVGMGVLSPGTLALITGTSTCQITQSAWPVFDPGLWGPFEDAIVAGTWALEAGQTSTGGTVRWLLDKLGSGLPINAERYPAADAAAAATPAGAEGLILLDFWQGSRTPLRDPLARGTIWGLTPRHEIGHLLRAVYEGTAYGNRHILEKLETLGVPTHRIIASGGGTRSTLWMQILADVAGLPITLTETADAVSLGSAMCAAVGSWCFCQLA